MKEKIRSFYIEEAKENLKKFDSIYKATRETATQTYKQFPNVTERTIRRATNDLRTNSQPYNLEPDKIFDNETDTDEYEIQEDDVKKDPDTILDELELDDERDENEQNWDYKDGHYIIPFTYKGKVERIPQEKVHYILIGYCEKGWTIEQLKRKTGESRKYIKTIRDAFQKTHDAPSPTAQQFNEYDMDELTDSWLARQEEQYEQDKDLKWLEFLEGYYEENKKFQDNIVEPLENLIEENVPEYDVPYLDLDLDNDKRFCLIKSIYDLHLNKYGWADQTGDGYDIDIAKERLKKKSKYNLEKVLQKGVPEEILVIIGGDYFQFDSYQHETTRGTDVSEKAEKPYAEMIDEGNELMVSYIDTLRQVAPVKVMVLPGNHDEKLSQVHLFNYLEAFYRKNDDVDFVGERKAQYRLYYMYGKTVIGAEHGRHAKRSELASLLMNEAKTMWGKHEDTQGLFIVGDRHTNIEKLDNQSGIPIIQVPTLAGKDKWELKKGYKNRMALKSYIIDYEKGLDGAEYAPVL